ncbi:MAG: proton-conducting transporter membrane subunit [Candidatus Omnitrophota bacterium]
MSRLFLLSLGIPFIAGLISLVTPKNLKRLPAIIAIVASLLTLCLSVLIFSHRPISVELGGITYLLADNLSSFITLFIGLFGFLIVLYSSAFMKGRDGLNKYYAYILWTISASIGVAISNHLIIFLTLWGALGITLYLLIAMGNEGAPASAKKAFIIIGGSDALLLLGIAILWKIAPSLEISRLHIALTSKSAILSFACFALAAFAKAGAMPLHTWIPDSAEKAPTPVMALLPASLDKLLGIYFLFRVSVDIFKIQPNSGISLFLIIIGSITIIAAVMMALVQHNLKELLSYHAVSQVGYMVLGIGTANPIGIAGGMFHMLNNAVYKTCLFLGGGNVEQRTKTTDLSKLGGLAKVMPITFITFLIASFSISGIPPFNGFFSKWMVYQGIIELAKTGTKLWPIWLVAAMFGSALTLASFMKLIHTIFLGQPSKQNLSVRESPKSMLTPVIILAGLCIIFGVFAVKIPIKLFIAPSLKQPLVFSGAWNSSLATLFILVGLLIGFIIYLLGSLKSREVKQFIGGEDLEKNSEMRPSGVEFYNTVKEIPFLQFMYNRAEEKLFDIYEVGKNITFGVNSFFRYLHNGVLPTYCVWVLLGMIVIFLVIL